MSTSCQFFSVLLVLLPQAVTFFFSFLSHQLVPESQCPINHKGSRAFLNIKHQFTQNIWTNKGSISSHKHCRSQSEITGQCHKSSHIPPYTSLPAKKDRLIHIVVFGQLGQSSSGQLRGEQWRNYTWSVHRTPATPGLFTELQLHLVCSQNSNYT